jgi:hypothetical protein
MPSIKQAFPWLLLVCLAQLSCGEVEHCKEVEEAGCLKSIPLADGTCLFDLVPRAGICVKSGSEQDFCSQCAEGDLCVPERNQCVNFCAAPAILPGSVSPPEPIFCTATRDPAKPNENPMLSYEEVCQRRCRLQCQRWEQLCGDFRCEQGFCDRPEVQAKCATDCPLTAGARDLACLTRSCNDVRFARCDTMLNCPNGVAPDCATVSCSNDCQYGGQGLAGDGFCDDSDPASARYAFCPWGTDCTDCGPRKGAKKEPSYAGDICAFNVNCEGWTDSPVTSRAWCIEQGSIPGLNRCSLDCSREDTCPDGFLCRELEFTDAETGETRPRIEGGVSAKACFPMLCQ